MPPIEEGESQEVGLSNDGSVEDATEAFLKGFDDDVPDDDEEGEEDPADGQDDDQEEEQEESDNDGEGPDDEDGDGEGSDDGDGGDESLELDANAEYSIKIGDEVKKVSAADLTRIASQEAGIAERAANVSNQTRVIEAQGAYLAKVLEGRWNAAKTAVDRYKDVDLFKASRELEAEEFDALQTSIKEANAEMATIDTEAREFLKNSTEARNNLLRGQAQESLRIIGEKIPEWNDALYADVRKYAVSQGMTPDSANEVVDAGVIIMMHKAMQFDAAKVKTKEVKKLVEKTAKKTMRKSSSPADASEGKLKAAKAAAASTGSIDDVSELFFAATKQSNN